MGTYFGPAEVQSDGLQTLYLMNPNCIGAAGYGDGQAPASMVFLNPTANALNSANPHHPSSHHFTGTPLYMTAPASPQDMNRWINNNQEITAAHGFLPRPNSHLWTPVGPVARPVPTVDGGSSTMPGVRPHMAAQQGLSLSLSPQPPPRLATDVAVGGDEMRISGSSSRASSTVSTEISGMKSVLMNSKYLKAALEVLDEIVSIGKDFNSEPPKGSKGQVKGNRESPSANTDGEETKSKGSAELTVAERQELQMKKAKLVNMLDEVEQRYRQYQQQMQMVISGFEAVVGQGSARTYTAVALRTISRQFRWLRDGIAGQIRGTSRRLGEEVVESVGGGRLRMVEQQLRQQRALQQLGMVQQNPWRPQRGLPERAVSVLRAWLFEHFLHPYPKDSDKLMLANQTGLTRSQVSNWFINARVRLWKPMIEEMYTEETKGPEQNAGVDNKACKNEITNEDLVSKTHANDDQESSLDKDKQENNNDPKLAPNSFSSSPSFASTNSAIAQSQSAYFSSSAPIGSSNMLSHLHENEGMAQANPKKARTIERQNSNTTIAEWPTDVDVMKTIRRNENKGVYINFGGERPYRDGCSWMTGNGCQGGEFGSYPIGEIERLDPGHLTSGFAANGVSLTLGLQHCENITMSRRPSTYISNPNMSLGRSLDMGNEATDFFSINTPSVAQPAPSAYESIHIQNRKQFAAQLLHDFVA